MIAGPECDERCVESESALDDIDQGLRRHVLAEEGIRHRDAGFRETQVTPDFPEVVTKHRQPVRHVESVVRRQRAEDRFLEIDAEGGVVGGVVEHGGEALNPKH